MYVSCVISNTNIWRILYIYNLYNYIPIISLYHDIIISLYIHFSTYQMATMFWCPEKPSPSEAADKVDPSGLGAEETTMLWADSDGPPYRFTPEVDKKAEKIRVKNGVNLIFAYICSEKMCMIHFRNMLAVDLLRVPMPDALVQHRARNRGRLQTANLSVLRARTLTTWERD